MLATTERLPLLFIGLSNITGIQILTPLGREREVLLLLNRGLSNPQIAAELSISENTVKRHVNNIFRKTETQSRHEIIVKVSNLK